MVKNYYYAGMALNILSILAILIVKDLLPPLVPLFYGAVAGTAQLVPTLGLLIAPSVSIVITIINMGISIKTKDDFSKKVLSVTSLLVSILTTITIVKIIFLVGFF